MYICKFEVGGLRLFGDKFTFVSNFDLTESSARTLTSSEQKIEIEIENSAGIVQ